MHVFNPLQKYNNSIPKNYLTQNKNDFDIHLYEDHIMITIIYDHSQTLKFCLIFSKLAIRIFDFVKCEKKVSQYIMQIHLTFFRLTVNVDFRVESKPEIV